MSRRRVAIAAVIVLASAFACTKMRTVGVSQEDAIRSQGGAVVSEIALSPDAAEGRNIFRHDTFGDEYFWGDTLQLHRAIAGAKHGGVGPGVTPRQALAVGLKVDLEALDRATVEAIRGGTANLDDVATTLALLKANAVVGVKVLYGGNAPVRMGSTWAFCHA